MRIVPMRHGLDCSVACLAMLLGVTYEDALLALNQKNLIRKGTTVAAIRAAATTLGHTLLLRRRYDVHNETGILGVRAPGWDYDHLVILKDGVIYDPQDMTLWDFDAYMLAHHARPLSFLSRET